MKAFDDATVELGVAKPVTTCTAFDLGRTDVGCRVLRSVDSDHERG